MKRYRIFPFFDFDTRVRNLDPINDDWEEKVKAQHRANRENTLQNLRHEFGEQHAEQKAQNFIDLGSKPFSVIAFHNKFFAQARHAFVVGAYYPALAGACALGERILNHLIINLRESYRSSDEYKKIYRKDSFDDWDLAINVLESWGVLLPEVVSKYRELKNLRNRSIHFRPETDSNDRELSHEAIKLLQQIIGEQFSGFGAQPWFITAVPGEIYIKKEWEDRPFVKLVYLPNGVLLGPNHRVVSITPKFAVEDAKDYDETVQLTDEQFAEQRRNGVNGRGGG